MQDSTRNTLTELYLAGLERHLKHPPAAGAKTPLAGARALGLQAVEEGAETLDLARMHEEALIALVLPHFSERKSDQMVRRAGLFFTEVILPVEETHRGAVKLNVELKASVKALGERTEELAESNKSLELEIEERKVVEETLKISQTTSGQLLVKSRQMQEEMRRLSHRLLSVQEDERKRISRELHDVIAQTLTGINLRLGALSLQTTASAKDIHRRIEVTQKLVQKSMNIVHRFASDLRPAALDDLGLVPALRSHLKTFEEETGVAVEFEAFDGVEALDIVVRTALYRVVQEALTNIARHAGATRAEVSIAEGAEEAEGILLRVTDNGGGFRTEETDAAGSGGGRLGLLSMRERVEMVGGVFSVESAPGTGTVVRVEIPRLKAGKKTRVARKPDETPA